MKTLVTGGAGFIGSHLVEKLVETNNEVTVLDNLVGGFEDNLKNVKHKIKFIKCDLSTSKDLDVLTKNVDKIFHLAGLTDAISSIEKPDLYYNSNVNGTFNILNAAKKNKVKNFLYAASASCYGNVKTFPTNELAPIDLNLPYSLTKWLGEQLVMYYSNFYKLPATSLRLFNVYGPRAKIKGTYGSVLSIFLKQKLERKPLTIIDNGEQSRDFIYVDDVVNAFIKASNILNYSQIFNIGSGKSIKINDLAKIIGGEKTYIKKHNNEIEHSLADILKAKENLKWVPAVNLESGISKLFKKN